MSNSISRSMLIFAVLFFLIVFAVCFFFAFDTSDLANAEVSSLQVNVMYDLTLPMTGFNTMPYNSYPDYNWSATGTLTVGNSSWSFTSINFSAGIDSNRSTSRLFFAGPNSTYYQIKYRWQGATGFSYSQSGTGLSTTPVFIKIIFTSLPTYTGSNTQLNVAVKNLLKNNLTESFVVPESPVLEPASIPYEQYFNMIYNVYDFSTNEVVWENDASTFFILEIDFASYFYDSDYAGVVLWLDCYDIDDNLIFHKLIYGKSVADIAEHAYFLIALPDLYDYKQSNTIGYFKSYPEDGGLYYTTYSSTENHLTYDCLLANIDYFHYIKNRMLYVGYHDGYADGYDAGINTDKTLLSVMWQTFNLPFRLLFGTYDDTQGSPSYGSYVGGLFNFTILGVNIRAFCIGIMSFAIVLAVVRFVLGAKG